MDVLCVGMYRACSTWQYEVIAHLLEQHRGGTRLGYLTGEQYTDLAARSPAARGAWRVLKSHEGASGFADAIADGRAVAIYAHRDIRDVAYSLMHKRNLTFRELLTRGMIHQVLANDRFWAGQPGSITQRYDRLVADPVGGVAELARHLGIDLPPGEAAEVAAHYSFEANRARAERLGRQLRDGGGADPAMVEAHDGQTLLHWNHLREGKVGAWRDQATHRERAVLARVCGRWLADHNYEVDAPTPPAGPVAEAVGWEAAMVRGWVACRLRGLTLRFPRLARAVKPWLGIDPEAPVAPRVEQVRVDAPSPTPAVPNAGPPRLVAGWGSPGPRTP